ncbi:hypothetical protein SAMN06264364_12913 [Quadrisphaera granulorum]|uniref:Ig-like domain-containing protein n=2 Tax=Quadrisphaera granulorum TaxID=317664 RepID=A0A315ZTJ0_9ACTN|nr:hypothetical protein BXY45_12913 [Quadrisphaera granulorum]SZE98354.1 hypothetical protein SAMN06264364_12913 [Quadrisphaera granulorum]
MNRDKKPRAVSRRLFTTAVVSVLGVGAVPLSAAQAATPSPSPKLPNEYYRKSNQVSLNTKVLFDDISVRIQGDAARLFVPQTVKPGQPVRVVWLYHGAGSDQNAIAGGFKSTAHLIVERGAIAICQNAGGTKYSHPSAQAIQVAGWQWISSVYDVRSNTLRATSGGGALACETLGSSLIPLISGMYNVNAVYDLEALYNGDGRDRASIIGAFGDDPAAIHAANPARLPQSAWAGKTLRIVVSQPDSSDRTVPPEQHGLALLALASPVAAEATLRTHSNGHSTPGFADPDFMAAFARWAPPPPMADTTAPTVTITAPTAGATLTGTTTLSATASDDVAVTAVTFTVTTGATTRTLTATNSGTGTTWSAPLDTTTLANGTTTITATATDAAGNATTTAPVSATITNADTVAPTVTITAPTAGATVSGLVTATATASDNVGVTSVKYYANGRFAGSATLSGGLWRLGLDTRKFANGSYTITAVAADAAGNTGTSPGVTIAVRN